jgi:hypothetical protein
VLPAALDNLSSLLLILAKDLVAASGVGIGPIKIPGSVLDRVT